jgi:hypothetical protein
MSEVVVRSETSRWKYDGRASHLDVLEALALP